MVSVEINLKNQKWLFAAIYTPLSKCKNYFVTESTKVLDKFNTFENISIIGDSNLELTNGKTTTFMADIWPIILLITCF